MLMAAGTALALFFGVLWSIYYLLERDAEDAMERLSQQLLGKVVGAIGALSVLMGEMANAAGEVVAIVMQIPSLIIALLGFGGMSGTVDMSPGVFLVVALITFLSARAVTSSRAG